MLLIACVKGAAYTNPMFRLNLGCHQRALPAKVIEDAEPCPDDYLLVIKEPRYERSIIAVVAGLTF